MMTSSRKTVFVMLASLLALPALHASQAQALSKLVATTHHTFTKQTHDAALLEREFPSHIRYTVAKQLFDILTQLPVELTNLITSYIDFDTNQQMLCVQTLEAHKRYIRALAPISNTQFASASDDGTVKIWLLKQGTWLCMVTLAHNAPVTSIVILARNLQNATQQTCADIIASGMNNGMLSIWHRNNSKNCPLQYSSQELCKKHTNTITALALVQEQPSTFAALSEYDRTLTLWQRDQTSLKWNCLQTIKTAGLQPSLSSLPNKRLLLGATYTKTTLYQYDTQKNRLVPYELTNPIFGIIKAAITTAGYILSCETDHHTGYETTTLNLRDQSTLELLSTLYSCTSTHDTIESLSGAVLLHNDVPVIAHKTGAAQSDLYYNSNLLIPDIPQAPICSTEEALLYEFSNLIKVGEQLIVVWQALNIGQAKLIVFEAQPDFKTTTRTELISPSLHALSNPTLLTPPSKIQPLKS